MTATELAHETITTESRKFRVYCVCEGFWLLEYHNIKNGTTWGQTYYGNGQDVIRFHNHKTQAGETHPLTDENRRAGILPGFTSSRRGYSSREAAMREVARLSK